MRIAVVGSGVAGLVAAWRLHRDHEVTLFEADGRVGGHVHTRRVRGAGGDLAVDSGFIVFNERTYPLFCGILRELGVGSRESTMSFSVQVEATGLEYGGSTLDALFAQRRNLLRPSFHRMIRDILRFHREARGLLEGAGAERPLGEWIRGRRFSREFREHFLVPMASAIWSADPAGIDAFPGRTLARFLDNHGMLQVEGRPVWRTVAGGSATYVEAMTRGFRDRIRTSCPVTGIRRLPDRVRISFPGGVEVFDAVVVAAHADQALRMLEDPSAAEAEVLGAFAFQRNDAVLHTDGSLLPRSRRARSAWNAFVPREAAGRATLTYDMNVLQGLPGPEHWCVTLNRPGAPREDLVRERMVYHHPVLTTRAVEAQGRRRLVSGVRRTWYCGAWWGFGFHEDGVRSGLEAVEGIRAAAAS
ncbi:MAG: FAD-dependent oxidoreductase, partial [Planctomycetaceae bacterium]|nr:FAD-dependent oxidoreductase [Planctomycetaceae bacterium]